MPLLGQKTISRPEVIGKSDMKDCSSQRISITLEAGGDISQEKRKPPPKRQLPSAKDFLLQVKGLSPAGKSLLARSAVLFCAGKRSTPRPTGLRPFVSPASRTNSADPYRIASCNSRMRGRGLSLLGRSPGEIPECARLYLRRLEASSQAELVIDPL